MTLSQCEFLGSQAHLRTKSNGPPRPGRDTARHHTMCRRCRRMPHYCHWFPLPTGRCPRPLMALGVSAVPWLSVPSLPDANGVPSCQCCRGHGKCSASCFCRAATSRGMGVSFRAGSSSAILHLSSRCDTHMMNLVFIFKTKDQVHLFLAKASFAWHWVKFIYINKAQRLVGPVWIKAFP